MKTKRLAIAILAIMFTVCAAVALIPTRTANAKAEAQIGLELIEHGDFEDLGIENDAVLTSEPGVGNGAFKGFGLLNNEMGRHGQFAVENGNTYLKFGMYGGFTGSDVVLQVPAVKFDTIGKGVYEISLDVKPSDTVLEKCFYLRMQGGPAEAYNTYIIDFQDNNDAFDSAKTTESWNSAKEKAVAKEDGWYRVTLSVKMNDESLLAGRTLWFMAGIRNMTEADYFMIDNLSMKKVSEIETQPPVDKDELVLHGTFEGLLDGEETHTLENQAYFGMLGWGPSGEFAVDPDDETNTIFKLGMDYEGLLVNEHGNNTAIQFTGLNFYSLGEGIYTFEFDIKAFGDVVSKMGYIRTMVQPGDHNMVYLNGGYELTEWTAREWAAEVASMTATEKDGWFHFEQQIEISENNDNIACNMIWLMAGIIEPSADDYFAIDNVSFKKTGTIEERPIDDGSVEIPEEEQEELMADLKTTINEGEDKFYVDSTEVRNGWGAYSQQGLGNVVLEGDEAVLHMGYTPSSELVNEYGYNICGFYENDFNLTGPGHYTFTMEIKANGNVVENSTYFRTFLNPGDKTMAYLITQGTTDSTADWESSISRMEELGDGWYRYTRTFVVSNEKGNMTSDRFVIQMGYKADAIEQAEGDYYSIRKPSLKKVRSLPETRPVITSETEKTFDYAAPADMTFTLELNGNEIELVKNGIKSIGKDNFAYDEETKTLSIKKEYLSTLANGEYDFVLVTLGGNAEFKITVINKPVETSEDDPGTASCGSCSGSTGACGILGLALMAGAFIGKKRA